MSRDKRDAERAARRAKRLAERAEERARRAERQAERAAERAERLDAGRPGAAKPRSRSRADGQSFEDMVDDFAKRAEQWLDDQSRDLFGDSDDLGDGAEDWGDGSEDLGGEPRDKREARRAEREAARAQQKARKARATAERASRTAEDLDEFNDSAQHEFDSDYEQPRRHYHYEKKRPRRRSRAARWRRRGRSAHLYRDKQRGKFLGVCAGIADYFGRAPWEIRLYTVLGLFFIPSVTVPAYFISYFIMDDKPYYKRVTDRFEESLDSGLEDYDDEPQAESRKSMNKNRKAAGSEPVMNNVEAMKTAREKFTDIEHRLRSMESHVTSSRFELQREFKKIAGEGS